MTTSSSRTRRNVPPPQPAGGTAPRSATAYSRFIPREELGAFAAWSPHTLNAELDGGTAPADAGAPAAETPAAQAQVAAARQAGYQDGYRDGMAALDAFKKSFAQQMSAQIGQLVQSFDAEFREMEEQMAQALAAMATELARQVVRSELSQRPELIAHVAHDAVEALQLSARHVRVRVNPEDLPLVLEGAGEEMKAREAQIIPDAEVARGGCKVDSDIGSVDATLPARWLQISAAMGQQSLWEDRRAGEVPAADIGEGR